MNLLSRYEIKQDFLPEGVNNSGKALNPIGLTIHETATPNATAEIESLAEHNHPEWESSAHYFADYYSIIQLIPEDKQAWHACHTANSKFLSLEMCHFDDDPEKFAEIWKRAAWFTAVKFIEYGWEPANPGQLNNHAWVSEKWGETDHTDPLGYFAQYGKTWDDFVNDVIQIMRSEDGMALLKDVDPQAYNAAVEAIQDLANRGIYDSPEVHIEALGKVDENDMSWRLFVGLDRVAKKAGITK